MIKSKLIIPLTFALVIAGSVSAQAMVWIDPGPSDGIRIQSPTRVQAGKYFQVKLTQKKGKISGICWLDWQNSNGFTGFSNFKMKKGSATFKLLPIQPGSGTMSFDCGTDRGNPIIGGSNTIYIAP